jgi:hypothetical protein
MRNGKSICIHERIKPTPTSYQPWKEVDVLVAPTTTITQLPLFEIFDEARACEAHEIPETEIASHLCSLPWYIHGGRRHKRPL